MQGGRMHAFSKHVTYYGQQSGFLYYNSPDCPDCPIHPLFLYDFYNMNLFLSSLCMIYMLLDINQPTIIWLVYSTPW
jgi:hypothetical protein